MRKAPFIILMLVVVFVAAVVGVLVRRARIPRAIPTERVATNADYRLKQIHLQEQGRDGSRWQLDAEYSETFEDQNKTTMTKVVVKVDQAAKGDKPSRSWTVTGDEGDLNQETKDVVLRGNVVLVSSDGLRLETDRLNWDADGQRAWTQGPVVIYRSGAIVQGTGFESRVTEEVTNIKGRVRATFKRSPMSEAAAPDRS
ncbi:MAG TPA: LPS export ABC transporter periplasmic protein LptC [Methylomirabilota bacterium]|nr:LPS export ABC transporter periplasmic protein LptC [Methylomirabilota bacterium]